MSAVSILPGRVFNEIIINTQNQVVTRQADIGAFTMLVGNAKRNFWLDIQPNMPFFGSSKDWTVKYNYVKDICPTTGGHAAIGCGTTVSSAHNAPEPYGYVTVTAANINTIRGKAYTMHNDHYEGASYQVTIGDNRVGFDLDRKMREFALSVSDSIHGMLIDANTTALARLDFLAKAGSQVNGQLGAYRTAFVTADADNAGSLTIARNAFQKLSMQYSNGLRRTNFATDVSLLVPSNFAEMVDNLSTFETVTNAGVTVGGTTNYMRGVYKDAFLNGITSGNGDWDESTPPVAYAVENNYYGWQVVTKNRWATFYQDGITTLQEFLMKLNELQNTFNAAAAQVNNVYYYTIPYQLAGGDRSFIPIDIQVNISTDNCAQGEAILQIQPSLSYIEILKKASDTCGNKPSYNGIVKIIGCALPATPACAASATPSPVSCTAVTGATFPLAVGCNKTGTITFTDSLLVPKVSDAIPFQAENMTAVQLVAWLNVALTTNTAGATPYGSFSITNSGTIQFCHTNAAARIVAAGGEVTINISGVAPIDLVIA